MRTRHHLIPKARRAELKHIYKREDFQKTLNLWKVKHHLWHSLFGNQTLNETIAILKRIKRIKKL